MLEIREIKHFMEEDAASEKKKMARQGLKYYEGEHKIMGARLFYFDADGELKEDTLRSNIRISHPFFTELVDQEVQYMLSGGGGFIKSDDPELQDRLDQYFDDAFWSEVYEMLTGCVSKGFDYTRPQMTGSAFSGRIPWGLWKSGPRIRMTKRSI